MFFVSNPQQGVTLSMSRLSRNFRGAYGRSLTSSWYLPAPKKKTTVGIMTPWTCQEFRKELAKVQAVETQA